MRILIGLALAAFAAGPALAASTCSDIDPPAATAAADHARPLTAEDLVRLRDIGWSGSSDHPLSVSPDGRHVAFQLRRADIEANSYCFAMIILDLDGTRGWRRVDTGGEPIFTFYPAKIGITPISSGVPQSAVAQWFPDGQSIAYLRRDHGVTQIWRAGVAGGDATQITHSAIDVVAFALAADGHSIMFSTRPGFVEEQKRIEAEGLSGFHYDDRFYPYEDMRPMAIDRSAPTIEVVQLADGLVRPALTGEQALLHAREAHGDDSVAAPDGRRATTVPTEPERVFLSDTLTITDAAGKALPCNGAACRGTIRQMWWGADGALVFLKFDGPAKGASSLYRWTAADPSPRRLLQTDDLLAGCVPAKRQLVCTYERSNVPRRIATVDLSSGAITPIFDPNPEVRTMSLPSATRLSWTNEFGIPTFGDLVLPPGHRDGEKLPMVIVQYSSRGFLRGGTGDEVPIPLMAQEGFAVLSFQRPLDYGEYLPSKTSDELERGDTRDIADRRSVQSSLDVIIQRLTDQGVIDPKRVGLTGLSDGASTVQFAMINSRRFAAFSSSQCCEEETSQSLAGPAVSDHRREIGFPTPGDRLDSFWDAYSVVRSVDRMNAPLLVQAADTEYTDGLQPWLVLRAHGKAMDMYVYPNERHIMVEPRHRLAIYRREIAWFAFWLQSRLTPFTSPAEAVRWQGWKDALAKAPVSQAPPPASKLPKLPPLQVPIS